MTDANVPEDVNDTESVFVAAYVVKLDKIYRLMNDKAWLKVSKEFKRLSEHFKRLNDIQKRKNDEWDA